MSRKLRRVACCAAVLACALAFGPATPPAAAQDGSKSGAAAKQLSEILDRLKLDSIAAADPANKDTFVAALYFQGAQLLVVSARYSAPSLLVDKLAKKDYRDTYIDLNAASVAGTKIFVMDHGADGLAARPGDSQAADSWEQGNTTIAFDGDWKKAKVSEEDYLKSFSSADERYSHILSLLVDQARKSGS